MSCKIIQCNSLLNRVVKCGSIVSVSPNYVNAYILNKWHGHNCTNTIFPMNLQTQFYYVVPQSIETFSFNLQSIALLHYRAKRISLDHMRNISNDQLFFSWLQRDCCIRPPLVTKLSEVVWLDEDVTQPDLKKSSPWYTWDLSLCQVSALLLKIHAFYWAPFPIFGAQILQLS